eukprot:1173174-Prorocentrum_minimum.AAC.1
MAVGYYLFRSAYLIVGVGLFGREEKKVVRSVKREKNAEEVVEVVSDVAEEEEIRELKTARPKKRKA